jgi:hypothetical protein
MIVFLIFGYWISFVMCVYIYLFHVCFKKIENEKNIRWIVISDVKESNGEIIELVGGWSLLRVCNRVIWYYVTHKDKKRIEEKYTLQGKLCCKFDKLKDQ